jgi:hypothetical protein
MPSIEEVLTDQATSFWLKLSLQQALKRDVVDAAQDARLLADLLTARADAVLKVAG